MDIKINDTVTLKNQHPCGSFDWQVLRVGMDFKLKCLGCGREVLVPRSKVEKKIKKILREGHEV